VGFDYVNAKVLDDRVNSDVDDNVDNYNTYTNIPGFKRPQSLRKKVQDQYSLAKDRLFEQNKAKEAAFETVNNPKDFDTLGLASADNQYHDTVRELVHRTEGLDMADFDHDDDTELFLMYSDIVECYSQSRRVRSLLLITTQHVFILALDTNHLVYEPLKLSLIDQVVIPASAEIAAVALKTSTPHFDSQSHVVLEREGAPLLKLHAYFDKLKTLMHLSYLVTRSDAFDVNVHHYLTVLNTTFNFHSLVSCAYLAPQSLSDMFKPQKVNVLTLMSGVVNKKESTWGDKFSLFGGRRTHQVNWKQRYLMLTNVGLLEYKQNRFNKPSKVFSVEDMRITSSEESYETNQTLYNKPFVFILNESDG